MSVAFCAGAATAWAHAELSRSEPAADAVLASPPVRVRLRFSEAVEASRGAIMVVAPDGTRVDAQDARTCNDGSDCVEVSLAALGSGTHAVEWRVVSADGHPITGAYSFSVGAPSAGGARTTGAGRSAALGWQGLGRFLHLCAVVTMLGLPAFGSVVLGGLHTPEWRRRLWRRSQLGFPLFVLAALLLLAGQSLALAGDLRPASVAELLTTRWGTLWAGRLVLAVLIVLAARAAARGAARGSGLAAASGAGLILLTSIGGHAATTTPVLLSVAIDVLHLAATVVWIGGLFALAFVVLPALRAAPLGERDSVLARLVTRFSSVALACVSILLVTGLYPTWAHVDSAAALTALPYGRALLVKWALVALLLIPAAANLLVVRPRLTAAASASREDAPRLFGRLVSVEVGLAVLVLIVVGFLTALPPARVRAAAARPSGSPLPPILTMSQTAGETLVTLRVEEADGPSMRLGVIFQDETGRSLPVSEARLRAVPPPDSSEPVVSSRMASEGDRHWCVQRLGSAGPWTLEVLFLPDQGTEQRAAFSLSMPLKPPADAAGPR